MTYPISSRSALDQPFHWYSSRIVYFRGARYVLSLTNEDGFFETLDGINSESLAQAIIALTALGIDPETDERFIKNDVSLLDALAEFYVTGGGFKHLIQGKLDGMATEQA